MGKKKHFEQLNRNLRGSLLFPDTENYEQARKVWNGMIDRKPDAIARCRNEADVQLAVKFARDRQLELSVKGGGHHVVGYAVCEGGLMVDLSLMNEIQVDPENETAHVGPGATVRDLDQATEPFGLMTTGAPVSMVGIAGYTLGGGLGWTSRLHGLACDNLLSAEVVSADGDIVHASEEEHSDLFWGIRGGSGNFGIITSFEFRLHKLGPDVLAGPVLYPMGDVPDILKFWRDHMEQAPDELQCMPVIFQGPDGDTLFCLYALYAGDPDKGEKVLAPIREMGNPLADQIAVTRYAGLLSDLDEMYRSGHRNYYRSAFYDTLPDEAIDLFAQHIAPVPTPFSSAFLEPMGGAIARKDLNATAFPHRKRNFCITAVPKWEGKEQDQQMEAWADNVFESLDPYAEKGVYVNYLADTEEEAVKKAYGSNWERLRKLKQKWDPGNLFSMNPNIPPAID